LWWNRICDGECVANQIKFVTGGIELVFSRVRVEALADGEAEAGGAGARR
jgi:hypothetical protein